MVVVVLTCSLGGAYLATQENSDEERRKVAEKWSKVLNTEIKSEQINCDGCTSNGRLFFYCQKRSCARSLNFSIPFSARGTYIMSKPLGFNFSLSSSSEMAILHETLSANVT